MQHSIVFLDQATLPKEAQIRSPRFSHQWTSYAKTASNEIVPRLKSATIAVVNKIELTAEILAELPKLQLIAITATGTNNIDLEFCRQSEIPVCNIRNYAQSSVPEHVIALIFALQKQLKHYQFQLSEGRWQQENQFCFFDHPIPQLKGQQLGIIGRGSLGKGLATLAEALGMRVVFSERPDANTCRQGYQPFEAVIRESDVISLHCPLTTETFRLIDEERLSWMKPTAILINTGRGDLVDEKALIQALHSKTIAGAGLDVLTEEPPSEKNPVMQALNLPNLIVTPHVAWASQEAVHHLCEQLIDNLEAWEQGTPQNMVVV